MVLIGKYSHLCSCRKSLSSASKRKSSVEERKLLAGGVSASWVGFSEQHLMLVLNALAGIQVKISITTVNEKELTSSASPLCDLLPVLDSWLRNPDQSALIKLETVKSHNSHQACVQNEYRLLRNGLRLSALLHNKYYELTETHFKQLSNTTSDL